MRSVFFNIALFVMLALAVSSLTGCGSQPNTAGNNTVAANTAAGDNKDKPTAPGSAYPMLSSELADTELEMIDGTKSKVSDRKGKVLLLNLWATWCGPCKAEMPTLIKLQDQYRDQGFQILGLDVGDGEFNPEPVDLIKKFSAQMNLNYELARVHPEFLKKINQISKADAVPQSFLIDREGRLRGVFVGGGPSVLGKLKTTLEAVIAE